MKLIFSFIVLCLLVSCGSEEENTVNYSELSPNSEKKERKSLSVDTVSSDKPTKSVYLSLIDSIRPKDQWQKWDTLLFPDRFGALTSEKWIVRGEKDSLILLHFNYADSVLTKNAFYNWIDCFGPKCNSYTVGGNIKLKGKYLYFFVNKNEIFYIESQKAVNLETVRSVFTKKKEKENWLYLVEAKPKGKTAWKKVVNGVETEIKNSYENIE